MTTFDSSLVVLLLCRMRRRLRQDIPSRQQRGAANGFHLFVSDVPEGHQCGHTRDVDQRLRLSGRGRQRRRTTTPRRHRRAQGSQCPIGGHTQRYYGNACARPLPGPDVWHRSDHGHRWQCLLHREDRQCPVLEG